MMVYIHVAQVGAKHHPKMALVSECKLDVALTHAYDEVGVFIDMRRCAHYCSELAEPLQRNL